MKHLTEEQLIAYQDGETSGRDGLEAHINSCAECRAELNRLAEMLAAYQARPVPDPGEDYGRRVWQQIAPRLQEKRSQWWQAFLAPQRLAAGALIAVLVLVAFLAGRVSKHASPAGEGITITATDDAARVRERVLMLAVGEHLGRSEMVLMEIANAGPEGASMKQVNLSSQRRRAKELLDENRLYRQTALQEGDTGIANVLDELERVLMDVAHSPGNVTPAQFKSIRQRIDDDGLLFKVRVLTKEIERRENTGKRGPAQSGSAKVERNNQA
ncbi:MAG TPA: zf-HC2 domain-containing protein [Candidatus Acidoferrum sp.]|jgi:predicted anti-sigma-YlaC factor YlaD|nr:zf-HC2 domain-containing protein [Candidatus Acidoferrum sp.]